jgi:predicted transcriptional regulator of viral defense system
MLARRRRPITVGRLKLEFISKRNVARTPVEIVSHSAVAPYRVSTREATLLDLVRHQNEVGGLENIVRIARDLVPKVTTHGLIEALDALDQTTVAQRLGFILAHVDKPLSRVIASWLEPRRLQKQALDPLAARRDGAVRESREWGIEFTPHQEALLRETRS